MSIIILYIQLHILKYINCIINCNIVLYLFSPCYINKYSVYISTKILKYINCIINHNIILYLYCPYVMLLIILYIQLHILKFINSLLAVILSYIHIFSMLYY